MTRFKYVREMTLDVALGPGVAIEQQTGASVRPGHRRTNLASSSVFSSQPRKAAQRCLTLRLHLTMLNRGNEMPDHRLRVLFQETFDALLELTIRD